MRWGKLSVLAAAAVMLAAPAWAQDQDENWTKCKDDNPDLSMAGCSAVIQANKDSKEDIALAYYSRAAAFEARGFYERAIQDYDKAIELYPKYARAFNKRGYAYWATLKYDRAIQDFDQAILLEPKLALAYNNRGAAYRDKGQTDRAIEDFDKAIALLPKFAEAFGNRGICYQAKKEYDRAITDYNQSIKLDPKIPRVYYDRGIAEEAKGQADLALADYGKAIELDPRYTRALLQRGNLHLAKGAADLAIKDYDQAIKIDGHNAQALASRGRAKFAATQFAASAGDFEQSLSLLPNQPYAVMWLHLARARAKADDAAELKRNAAKLNLKAWPGPLILYFMKQQTAPQVMTAAATGDEQAKADQSCEAAFYLGEDAVIRRATLDAEKLLHQARDTCQPSFIEYDAAGAELALSK
jgi:tetratricopeptide (TPR) repeat protein